MPYYGPADPALEADAEWITQFLEQHETTPERLAHVLGINQARIWEWKNQRKPIPPEAKQSLTAWVEDGKPAFYYWI